MKTPREIYARIAQMGWDERRTRIVQETAKRVDLTLYRLGQLSNQRDLNGFTFGGKFFFSTAELPLLRSFLKTRMSGEVENTIREADEICRHRFRLLKYENLDYGPDIDWHLDLIHGKRAPQKAWFKIDFLDFNEVGDHKIIWELNRHQHFVTLAKAWCFTGENRYADELRTQWYSWNYANPYPIGINWGSSLEVAFRSLSWIWFLSLLDNSPVITADFSEDVISGLARSARYIETYLSKYFSPNTHLLGEAAALFFIGTMCPQIPAAKRWQKKGWEILLDEAKRQVRVDGVYFEQSLYYHVYALDFFIHARILAAKNGLNIPSSFDSTIQKMLDVLLALSQAGTIEGFGDDDGGRVFNPRRNRCEHMTDPLALGAILFRRGDLFAVSKLTEESIWLFGTEADLSFDRPETARPEIASNSFTAGGVYIMASGEITRMQMVIDAGPQGTGCSGHGHADALSATVAIHNRRWLVDSGAFSYVTPEREQFRGTAAHNTLCVDGLDQAIANGPFAWKSIPDVHCEEWIEGNSFTMFEGRHNGYLRLADPVLHRRQILFLHNEFWLVRDVVEGRDEHEIEINWHFASDIILEKSSNAIIAKLADSEPGDGRPVLLALLSCEEEKWKNTIEAGFVSPAYGRKDPAYVMRSKARIKLPAEHATLLVPTVTPANIGTMSRVGSRHQESGSMNAYSYADAGRDHHMIFAGTDKMWTCDGWSSDARFLYFRLVDGRVEHLVVCQGSEVKLGGTPVVAHLSSIERFEWSRDGGKVFTSDEAAMNSFSQEAIESYCLT